MAEARLHQISASRDGLDISVLRARLCKPAGPYARLEYQERMPSTNQYLVEEVQADPQLWPDLSVLTVEEQTAGKGRLNRQWYAPYGASLAVSMVLTPHHLRPSQGRNQAEAGYQWLTMISALALCESLRELCTGNAQPLNPQINLNPQIKWPNDVLLIDEQGDAAKLAGILAQLVTDSSGPVIVLGMGVNISQGREELPEDGTRATSLALAGVHNLSRTEILASYLEHFALLYAQFKAGNMRELRQKIRTTMITIGQQVQAQLPDGQNIRGTAVGLDDEGGLQITDSAGRTHVVSAADITHLRPLVSTSEKGELHV